MLYYNNMRPWFIALALLCFAPLAQAETNVEPELCYMKINKAIKAGAQTGQFELRDKHCEKYKVEYDLKYGDPLRPRLKGEAEFSQHAETPKLNSEARDLCWDIWIATKYSRDTYIESKDCKAFLETALD